MKNINKQKQQ